MDIPRVPAESVPKKEACASVIFFDFPRTSIIVALSLKPEDREKGILKLPGGGPHENEAPAATAVRELEEEGGIDSKEGDLVPIWVREIYGHKEDQVRRCSHHVYYVGGSKEALALRQTGRRGECGAPQLVSLEGVITRKVRMPASQRVAVARSMLFLLGALSPLSLPQFHARAKRLVPDATSLILDYDRPMRRSIAR